MESSENISGAVKKFNEIAADRETIIIRHAEMSDVEDLAAVEAACFPAAEAATAEEIRDRVQVYGDHFWILEKDGKVISFVDGFVTDIRDLTDEMYEKATMHDAGGAWQMLFGVNTMPEARKKGYAGQLIRRLIAQAREENRKGVVLTCKDRLVKYYSTFGFKDEGVSESTHGNVVWHQMRLVF